MVGGRISPNETLWNVWPESLRLHAGEPDHLGPFLGFLRDELAKVGRRACKQRTSQVGEAFLYIGVAQSCIDLCVELLDNRHGRATGRDDPIPASRLIASQKY